MNEVGSLRFYTFRKPDITEDVTGESKLYET